MPFTVSPRCPAVSLTLSTSQEDLPQLQQEHPSVTAAAPQRSVLSKFHSISKNPPVVDQAKSSDLGLGSELAMIPPNCNLHAWMMRPPKASDLGLGSELSTVPLTQNQHVNVFGPPSSDIGLQSEPSTVPLHRNSHVDVPGPRASSIGLQSELSTALCTRTPVLMCFMHEGATLDVSQNPPYPLRRTYLKKAWTAEHAQNVRVQPVNTLSVVRH